MKKLLIILFLILLSSQVLAINEVFSINLISDGEKLKLDYVDLYEMVPNVYIEEDTNELVAKLISFKSEELFRFDLSKQIIVTDNGPVPENEYLNFVVPKYREAKELVITNKETREIELVVDLTEFQLCNFDDYCDFDENKETCPEDCVVGFETEKEETVVDEEKDKPIVEDKAVIVEEKSKLWVWILIASIIVVGVIILILRKKK